MPVTQSLMLLEMHVCSEQTRPKGPMGTMSHATLLFGYYSCLSGRFTKEANILCTYSFRRWWDLI